MIKTTLDFDFLKKQTDLKCNIGRQVSQLPDLMGYMKATNYREVTTTTKYGDITLPLVDVQTKERGLAPLLFGDIASPKWRDDIFDVVQFVPGLTIIPNGTPERLLQLADKPRFSDTDWTKNLANTLGLSRFYRYFKKDVYNMCLYPYEDLNAILVYIRDNTYRFSVRHNKEFIFNEDLVHTNLLSSKLFNHEFLKFDNNEQSCIIEIVRDDDKRVIHWVNTYRSIETENTRLGNNSLFALVLYVYNLGYDLNLGIDTFDYKTLWSPVQIYVKGFSY